jgi:flagellar hook-associated protein 3 FlgL
MTRISTANLFQTGVTTLQQRESELNRAQQQLTSGKKINRLSDDPSASARAERARAAEARASADQRALDASRSALTQVEGAYGNATELLQQARELMVAAGNSSYGPNERRAIAQQVNGIRAQLLAVANRGNGAGGFLLGGQGSGGPPFVDAPGGVTYAASAGSAHTASSEPLPLALDGRAAYLEARRVNGAFDLSIFDTLDTAASVLNDTNATAGQVNQAVADGLRDLDAGAAQLDSARADAGAWLQRLDNVEDRVAGQKLLAQEERSNAEDLDMVHAISDFQLKQTGYDAALRAYSQMQRLSLFNYLG